jgi:hypothetical membrane protein
VTIWVLVRAAILWFVVCAGAGMALYPGGTRLDPGTVGYSFTQNAFSDLGRTVARNGEPNTVSATLFVLGLTPAGLGLAGFFVALLPLVSKHSRTKGVAWFGCAAGIVAGVAYVAVAWTPANRLPFEHVMAQNWAFRSFLVASVLLGFVTARSTVFSFRTAAAWWMFGVLLLAFILIGIFGPSRRTEAGLVLQVVAQKAIVFSALVIVAFQSYEAERAARRLATGSNRPRGAFSAIPVQPATSSNVSANF